MSCLKLYREQVVEQKIRYILAIDSRLTNHILSAKTLELTSRE
jgi:hypothetical protein